MFFFPGADGVRDLTVTGVQTCALPILLGFGVSSGDNVNIMECRNSHSYGAIDQLLPGEYTIRARVEQNILRPGLYLLNVGEIGRAACRETVYSSVVDVSVRQYVGQT